MNSSANDLTAARLLRSQACGRASAPGTVVGDLSHGFLRAFRVPGDPRGPWRPTSPTRTRPRARAPTPAPVTSTAAPSIRGGSAGHPGSRLRASSPSRRTRARWSDPVRRRWPLRSTFCLDGTQRVVQQQWSHRDPLAPPGPADPRSPGARGGAPAPTGSCPCSALTTVCCTVATPPVRATQFLLECLADLDASPAPARQPYWSCATDQPEVSCRRSRVNAMRAPCHFSDDVGPFSRAATTWSARSEHPDPRASGTFVVDDPRTRSAPRPRSRTRCSRRSTGGGRSYRDAGSAAHHGSCRRSRRACQPGLSRRSPISDCSRRSRSRAAAAARPRAHGDPQRLGAPLALPPLRVPIATRDRGARHPRGETPTVLARLLRPRAAAPSPERALRAPGAVPRHDPLEPRSQAL